MATSVAAAKPLHRRRQGQGGASTAIVYAVNEHTSETKVVRTELPSSHLVLWPLITELNPFD